MDKSIGTYTQTDLINLLIMNKVIRNGIIKKLNEEGYSSGEIIDILSGENTVKPYLSNRRLKLLKITDFSFFKISRQRISQILKDK